MILDDYKNTIAYFSEAIRLDTSYLVAYAMRVATVPVTRIL
jgi:hypothetical protein